MIGPDGAPRIEWNPHCPVQTKVTWKDWLVLLLFVATGIALALQENLSNVEATLEGDNSAAAASIRT